MNFHNICCEFTESLKLLSVAHPFNLHRRDGLLPAAFCLPWSWLYVLPTGFCCAVGAVQLPAHAFEHQFHSQLISHNYSRTIGH